MAVQNGLTVKQLGETIHAHPTIAEAVMEAAHDVHGESVHIAQADDDERGCSESKREVPTVRHGVRDTRKRKEPRWPTNS